MNQDQIKGLSIAAHGALVNTDATYVYFGEKKEPVCLDAYQLSLFRSFSTRPNCIGHSIFELLQIPPHYL